MELSWAERTFRWLRESPGLLRAEAGLIVSDVCLRELGELRDAAALSAAITPAVETRRLGRIFESLVAFAIVDQWRPSRIDVGVPIRAPSDRGQRTIGELDLLFDRGDDFAEHWELSVKFYICLREGSTSLADFMGTFVEDRLDRKLTHLFRDQLPLVDTDEARTELEQRGWTRPFVSRALMKGLFFYPATELAWRGEVCPLPPELSSNHERGWWTTSNELCFPRVGSGRFVRLDQLNWLGRFEGAVTVAELMSEDDLRILCATYFEGSLDGARLRRRELTVAEVEPVPGSTTRVREIARGHIVHADWPALAQWASERTIAELEISQREHSKRPR